MKKSAIDPTKQRFFILVVHGENAKSNVEELNKIMAEGWVSGGTNPIADFSLSQSLHETRVMVLLLKVVEVEVVDESLPDIIEGKKPTTPPSSTAN